MFLDPGNWIGPYEDSRSIKYSTPSRSSSSGTRLGWWGMRELHSRNTRLSWWSRANVRGKRKQRPK